jgi:hypothetical protein
MDKGNSKPISWQACYDKSAVINLKEVEIPVIQINHLIRKG